MLIDSAASFPLVPPKALSPNENTWWMMQQGGEDGCFEFQFLL
jgi:hypothetical protein